MSLSYDTAKRLKEAGWKQDYSKGLLNGGFVWEYDDTDGDIAYAPNLSELIGACGDSFDFLQNKTMDDGRWRAVSGGGIDVSGDTREEAVAELWLVLNKQHETK